MKAFAAPIQEGQMEYWTEMVLDNMLEDNQYATDASRENARLHERSNLQKMPDGHVCILPKE